MIEKPALADHPIRVALVSPAGAIRAGLRALLTADSRLVVVQETSTLQGLGYELDVAVVVIQSLREAGDRLFWQDRPGLGVLFLTDEAQAGWPAGFNRKPEVWGVLALDAPAETLCAALRALDEGLLAGDPHLMRAWMGGQSPERLEEGEELTPRELEVLQQLALGLTNKQIALALGISEHTAKYHISAIYGKLGVINRAEAVRVGMHRGWIAV